MTIGIAAGVTAQADGPRRGHPPGLSPTSRSSPTAVPDVGFLCAAAASRTLVYGFVSLDSIALEPHSGRPAAGTIPSLVELARGCSIGAVRASYPAPVPPHPPGSAPMWCASTDLRTVRSPYEAAELGRHRPPLPRDAAHLPPQAVRRPRNAASGSHLYFRLPVPGAAAPAGGSSRRGSGGPPEDLNAESTFHALRINRSVVFGGGRGAQRRPLHSCDTPTTGGQSFQKA